MLDKMARAENVVGELTLVLGIKEGMIPVVKDAAALAMSDLATSIVTEFTSLAGIMARHYASRDGLPEEIGQPSGSVRSWMSAKFLERSIWTEKDLLWIGSNIG